MDADDVMSADDAIRTFTETEKKLPIGAMLWCRANWRSAAPALLEVLERYVEGADRSEAAASAVFMIVHLAAERGETRVFAPLCRLAVRDSGALEYALGDGVTETFSAILIGTYDGDLDTLKALIEAPQADEYARCEALEALGYLAASGRVDTDAVATYLRQLYDRLQPQEEMVVWWTWALVIALLRLEPLAEVVRQAFGRGLIPLEWADEDDYAKIHRDALCDPDPLASFAREGIVPLGDAIDELSEWAAFSESDDDTDAKDADIEEADLEDFEVDEAVDYLVERMLGRLDPSSDLGSQTIVTAVNRYKDVGRNDPCPCGSGKKFKKCCLATQRA
jgi:uncharacterized protein